MARTDTEDMDTIQVASDPDASVLASVEQANLAVQALPLPPLDFDDLSPPPRREIFPTLSCLLKNEKLPPRSCEGFACQTLLTSEIYFDPKVRFGCARKEFLISLCETLRAQDKFVAIITSDEVRLNVHTRHNFVLERAKDIPISSLLFPFMVYYSTSKIHYYLRNETGHPFSVLQRYQPTCSLDILRALDGSFSTILTERRAIKTEDSFLCSRDEFNDKNLTISFRWQAPLTKYLPLLVELIGHIGELRQIEKLISRPRLPRVLALASPRHPFTIKKTDGTDLKFGLEWRSSLYKDAIEHILWTNKPVELQSSFERSIDVKMASLRREIFLIFIGYNKEGYSFNVVFSKAFRDSFEIRPSPQNPFELTCYNLYGKNEKRVEFKSLEIVNALQQIQKETGVAVGRLMRKFFSSDRSCSHIFKWMPLGRKDIGVMMGEGDIFNRLTWITPASGVFDTVSFSLSNSLLRLDTLFAMIETSCRVYRSSNQQGLEKVRRF